MLYSLMKSLLFKLPPERAHELTLEFAHLAPALGSVLGINDNSRLHVQIGQTLWRFPLGLAAGLDKNAEALDFFANQGFGALECGTITLMPQEGNPRPRIFRYPAERSLRNAMGFPNRGLNQIIPALKPYSHPTPLGANIGKNKNTTAEGSLAEIKTLFEGLASYVDYFVVNVSSPNTPGLRALQERGYLTELFQELNRLRQASPKDLYLKIAPDLEEKKIFEISELAQTMNLTGLIATNTTIMPEKGIGGISGELLKETSRKVRHLILAQKPEFEVIGVGGFSGIDDLFDFWEDGGKVAQVYTSYIYQGPKLLRDVSSGVLRFLNFSGINSLHDFFLLKLSERKTLLRNYRERN
jgi:dihydroorotate dehydrogenase